MKRLTFLFLILFPFTCFGAVLFTDSFDASDDWEGTQQASGTRSCTSSCGIPGGWTGYYIEGSYCDGVSGEPGNHTLYIDSYADYPGTSSTCYGGSGKCLTHWQESCDAIFQDSDGQLSKDLGDEYEDVYFKFHIKFKPSFERKAADGYGDGFMFKLNHVQHYDPSTNASWWQYFGSGPTNQPVMSAGLAQYSNVLHVYAVARCQNTYYCYGDIHWPLSTITNAYNAGGLFDGEWHSLVFRVKRNSSIGTADGLVEFWYDGTKKDYESGYEGNDIPWNDTGSAQLRGFRLVSLPGNSYNQFDTSCANMADCEQWYSIDDVRVTTTLAEALDDAEDTTAPTILSVSSDKANGSYKSGEIIDIDVSFSEVVTSTGNVTVTLETGDTDRTCTFTVTSSNTGTCNYTVQAGDTSADLQATISGTIADANSNAMSNFTPTTNLAANKALVIDTTAPSVTGFTIPSTSTLTVTISTFTCSGQSHFIVTESAEAPASDAAGWVASAPATYTFSGAGEKTLYAWCKDTAGNVSTSLNDSVTVTSGINKAPFVIQ